jgi:hypothetical protein
MNSPLQSPLGRVVARTPMMPIERFTLLRSTWWAHDGWIVAHEAELPEGLREQLVRWATTMFGRRMKR